MYDLVKKVASIDVPEGTTVTFNKKRQHDFGNFQAIGLLSTTKHKSVYDILEVFEQLDRKTQAIFNRLKRQRDPYGRIECKRTYKVGTSDYKQHMRCLHTLTKHELVVPIKVSQYPLVGLTRKDCRPSTHKQLLLNPNFIRSRFQGDALIYWNNITKDNLT